MDPRARRECRGFTLIEVIVALAVILILAAVALPQVTGYLDQKRIEATADQLAIVRDALYKTGGQSIAFEQTVGANAGQLSQLVIPLTTADRNNCDGTFSTNERGNWPDEGPYVNFMIDPTNGMATPIGQADNDIGRLVGATDALLITWTNTVSLDDASNLDLYVDGVAGWNAGTVRWTPQLGTNGMVTLYYHVAFDGSC